MGTTASKEFDNVCQRAIDLVTGYLRHLSKSFETNNPYYNASGLLIHECIKYNGHFIGHYFRSNIPNQPQKYPFQTYCINNGYHNAVNNWNGKSQIDNDIIIYSSLITNYHSFANDWNVLYRWDILVKSLDDYDQIFGTDTSNLDVEIHLIVMESSKCNNISYKICDIGHIISIEFNTKIKTIKFIENNKESNCKIYDAKQIINHPMYFRITFKNKSAVCECVLKNCKITRL